jgi:hypothetical protein
LRDEAKKNTQKIHLARILSIAARGIFFLYFSYYYSFDYVPILFVTVAEQEEK